MTTATFKVFGEVDDAAVAQLENVLRDERAVGGAIMADGHLGYSLPIGGVVAYKDAISPTGVGYDIACGNMAVKTNIREEDVFSDLYRSDLMAVMKEIEKTVAFGIGRSNPKPVDHKLFDSPVWLWLEAQRRGLKQKSEQQLGTVGSGNHYVDLLVDEDGWIWTANHFGSRGLGHTIASGFMAMAAGLTFDDKVPEGEEAVVFDTDSELGAHYLACMELAGEYAYAGRELVIEQVLKILGAEAVQTVHNHHNFAWQENGQWIVRKGATPLTTQPAFIGGSMGDDSVIVRGRPTGDWVPSQASAEDVASFIRNRKVEDIGNLGSAPHGAGRVMSRTAAAGKLRKMWVCLTCGNQQGRASADMPVACVNCGHEAFTKRHTRDISTAGIDWQAVRGSLKDRGIVVRGAGADESPGVYKSLQAVLGYHSNIEVLHRLTPIGVVMAGANEFDPYKD